ncbi:hypothetical protein CROQUDRAFT_47905, partial [Cronartium quercuum f. sp. fusiforme G11]
DAKGMNPFCSNTLANTQCNGLTRSALMALLSTGLCHGLLGLGLGGYLWRIKYSTNLGWLSALEGIMFSLAAVMEAASRFNPGDLDSFVSLEKFTATLGVLSSILFLGSQISACTVLIPPDALLTRPSLRKIRLIMIPALSVIAITSLVFDILAFNAVYYEISKSGIRVGAYNQAELEFYATRSVILLVVFLGLVGFTNPLLSRLSKRLPPSASRTANVGSKSFNNSHAAATPVDIQVSSSFQRLPIRWLQGAILVSIFKNVLALWNVNTIVARRAIGLFEYCAYIFVTVHWSRKQVERGNQQSRFFTTLHNNSEFSLPEVSESCSSNQARKPEPSAFYHRKLTEHIWTSSNLSSNKKVTDRRFRRLSTDTGVSFSTLVPGDSASTAAFLPRPPPAPLHLRERTLHGPHGSVLVPLREEILLGTLERK